MRIPRVNYQGDDTAKFIHNNKTHRTVDEAFRTADYATGLWRCETEWDRVKENLLGICLFIALLGGLYLMGVWFARVMP